MDELEDLKKENQQLKEEIEQISRINSSLIRQIKERSNAAKGQYPKKQHTGYSLVSSVQKEYRYNKSGSHKTVWIFETVFQTPYDIGFNYQDVLDAVYDDVIMGEEENPSIIEKLGFSGYYGDKTYTDFYEGENIKNNINELLDMYREEKDTTFIPDDVYKKIKAYSEEQVRTSCYNLNVRMNGKAGYWEMTFNHIEPLTDLPPELRFPIKIKKKKNDNDKEKEVN